MILSERNPAIELPNRNPHGINPALMTFDEYYKMANKHDKFHPDEAYDVDLKQLNGYLPKSSYDKLYRRTKIHGLDFEIWLYKDGNEWGLGVFNGDTRVAAVQDEWGCLLVMVAKQYRGFGFGPILTKMARTIQPDRPSGGFTPSGYRNFVKVYHLMVREALATGLYHRLISQGQITMERVKAIIASANLPKQEIKPARNLKHDDPANWLLYVGEHGDFVLYDKKLKDLINEGGEENRYWIDQMIKGFAYVQLHDGHREKWAMLRQFGGDSPAIKKFLINCAVQLTNTEDYPLYLEPDEIEFIDKRMIDRVEDVGNVRGFKSFKVIPTGEDMRYEGMGLVERKWRKSFDRYDEFYVQMIELAHSKYQVEPKPQSPYRYG